MKDCLYLVAWSAVVAALASALAIVTFLSGCTIHQPPATPRVAPYPVPIPVPAPTPPTPKPHPCPGPCPREATVGQAACLSGVGLDRQAACPTRTPQEAES
jgi:hypothetical protein